MFTKIFLLIILLNRRICKRVHTNKCTGLHKNICAYLNHQKYLIKMISQQCHIDLLSCMLKMLHLQTVLPNH